MALQAFPVAAVIERLRSRVPALRAVDGAAGLEAAERAKPDRFPAAFVIANEKGNAPHGYSGGVLAQKVEATVVVVLFVEHAAKAGNGSKAQEALDALRGAVRDALVNWRPMTTPGATALRFVASDGESFSAGALVGQEAYAMTHTQTRGSNP